MGSPPSDDARAPIGDGEGLVVVTEQAAEHGGMERTIGEILGRFPAARCVAPNFTDTNVPPGDEPAWAARIERIGPALGRRRHVLGPLYARRMAAMPLLGASVVLTMVSHGWGLGVRIPPGARHVCFRTGPSRLVYGHLDHYIRDESPMLRAAARAAIPALRAQQRSRARRPDRTVTPSTWSASRLRETFGVDADVVSGPVDTTFLTPAPRERTHVLCVARMVWHKRIDAVLDAAARLPDVPFVLVGSGPVLDELRAAAPPNVRFTGWVSDDELRELYRGARALVHPNVEEFGLTMAEALACGTRVVAPASGGALDIVDHPATGVLLDPVDVGGEAIAAALTGLEDRPHDVEACRRSAARFDTQRFLDGLEAILDDERALAAGNPLPPPRDVVAA